MLRTLAAVVLAFALAGFGSASAEESKCVSRVQWTGKCFEMVEIGCDLEEFKGASKAWAQIMASQWWLEGETTRRYTARNEAVIQAAESRWRRSVKACAP